MQSAPFPSSVHKFGPGDNYVSELTFDRRIGFVNPNFYTNNLWEGKAIGGNNFGKFFNQVDRLSCDSSPNSVGHNGVINRIGQVIGVRRM